MPTAAEQAVARHLAPLGERWAIWRWVALRGAGMPVDWLARLSRPGLADLGEQEFTQAVAELAADLRALATEPALREAITWQNRHALRTGVDVMLAAPGRRSSKYRQKEALVARYLQRYCAKNDTIGFFGPVGWARVRDDGPDITVRPGAGLLADRTTYLEGWCADEIAAVIAADEQLLPWLAPRIPPFLRLDGDRLHRPLAAPITLAPGEAAVLARCDGETPAHAIATALTGHGFGTPAEVLGTLHRLVADHRIVWGPQIAADDPDPIDALRDLLRPLPAGPSRQRAAALVDALAQRHRAVAAATGDPDRLGAALTGLEEWFTGVTGAAATRNHGRLYAGRTLVYEDCRRDLDAEIGPGLLADLAPPLELLLTSARWFTERALELYRAELLALHDRLAARHGPDVPFENLWLYAQDLVFRDAGDAFGVLASEVRRRWATVLATAPGPHYTSDGLRDAVERVFATTVTTPGITRYCCPDVMIAASGTDAIRAGEHQFVLGELHAGFNTLTSAFFARQHPAPDELADAVEHDLPEPQIVAVFSREVPSRMMRGLVAPRDLRVLYAQDSCGISPEVAVPVSSLVARRDGGTLTIFSRDGRISFESMVFFGELVMVRAHRAFGVSAPAPHTPRLTIDRLVVERETWRLPARDPAFAWISGEHERFRAARRWREQRGLPRHVFVRTARDAKPLYADFDSPVLIDLLSRAVRRAADDGDDVTISEMLPGPEHAWLPDAQGRRYTSELRLVAIARQPGRELRHGGRVEDPAGGDLHTERLTDA
jgi:hypothetical protein